ncbi:unnamed protein product [Polarella glacialis]|uniref:Uncharacterized protein n=1 Tax=Polarella glacialis TaxID=89957 RepID=A0A813EFU0_POLGL|nr:unnamed protein product [Polarella glacialis]
MQPNIHRRMRSISRNSLQSFVVFVVVFVVSLLLVVAPFLHNCRVLSTRFEPVSVAKASRGRLSDPWHLATPNWDELLALLGRAPQSLQSAMAAAYLRRSTP